MGASQTLARVPPVLGVWDPTLGCHRGEGGLERCWRLAVKLGALPTQLVRSSGCLRPHSC